MPQFRTKKSGSHKGDVYPLDIQGRPVPRGKPALKKNIRTLKVENKEKLSIEAPKEPKSTSEVTPPSSSVVQNVQKPIKEKTIDGT